MKSEFEIAITQLSSDRNLAPEVILEAIEAALVSAYKRNYGSSQNVSVTLNPRTGEAQVFVKKAVVDQVEDELAEIPLAEARLTQPNIKVGDYVDIQVKPRNFGRIAAQTAKQVITQRIREAERDSVYLEYVDRVGEIVTGTVRNIDSRSHNVVLSLGKAEVVMPRNEQIPREHYRFSQRLRVYISSVDRSGHGPQITVSRAHRDLLRRLLELEVPEIFNGTVEIKAIAREPGFRSKVAVHAVQAGIDPVGSCVGMRGVRIQNIVNELNGEKIDVVAWSPDTEIFIANALSPAKVVEVQLNEPEKTAKVVVPDRSLSLAIGKEGQNARLAAKLTGWRIDIKSEAEAAEDAIRLATEMEEQARVAAEREEARQAAAELLAVAEATLDGDGGEHPEEITAVAADSAVAADEAPEAAATDAEAAVTDEVVAEAEIQAEVVPSEATDVAADADAAADADEPEPEAEQVLELEDEEWFTDEEDADDTDAEEPSPESEDTEEATEESSSEDGDDNDDDDGDDDDDDDDGSPRDKRKKSRSRRLEFDEELGRVVARKRRKPSRRSSWSDDWQEDDFES